MDLKGDSGIAQAVDYLTNFILSNIFTLIPQRFNVAITRAQAFLILMGNPDMLCLDENWKTCVEQITFITTVRK